MTNEEFFELAKQPIDEDGDFSLFVRNMSCQALVVSDGCGIYYKESGTYLGKRHRVLAYIRGLDGSVLSKPITDKGMLEVRQNDE